MSARSSFLLLCCASLALQAQYMPTEVVGDTGWAYFGADTISLVRAADGNAWTMQNLGASRAALAMNDTASYGNYYQWGRWTDGHELPNSTAVPATVLAPNDPSGLGAGSPDFYHGVYPNDWWSSGAGTDTWQGNTATATNGIDPCSALGAGWQLPTANDWSVVLTAEGVTGTASAFSSNLRIPVAGYREGQNATVINAGLYASYWSSTTSGAYAKDLQILVFAVNPTDDGYRSHGSCLRCLNKGPIHTGTGTVRDPASVRLFPNPATDLLHVQWKGSTQAHDLSIHDAVGGLVKSGRMTGPNADIDISNMAPGLYFLTVISNGQELRSRFVKR